MRRRGDDVTDAEQLYEHRADEGEWDDEPADVRVRPTTTEVVSFRLSGDELDRIQDVARRRGVSLSEFIRKALEHELEGGPLAAFDDVWIGAVKAILGSEWMRHSTRPSASQEAEFPATYQVVPDFPPTSQNVTSSEGAGPIDDSPRLPLDA